MVQWAYFASERVDSAPVELIWSDNQLQQLASKGANKCVANGGTLIPHSMRHT
jgi:hypothetical protein